MIYALLWILFVIKVGYNQARLKLTNNFPGFQLQDDEKAEALAELGVYKALICMSLSMK